MLDPAQIPFRETSHSGIALHFLHRDEESGRAIVLIRMEPGCGYPTHRHIGTEEVLVLQGGYRDEQGEHEAGEFVSYADGTTHTPVALELGEPCVLFAIAERGIELAESSG